MATASLAGMSVMERTDARGLIVEWDKAVRARDRESMMLLLRRVALFDAPRIADLILADPSAYGY